MDIYAFSQNSQPTLPIGQPATYELRETRCDFGVYQRCPENGPSSFIIARLPSPKNPSDYQPASVARAFSSEAEAVAVLEKWATARLDPGLPQKPKPAGKRPEATHRKGHPNAGADQMQLSL